MVIEISSNTDTKIGIELEPQTSEKMETSPQNSAKESTIKSNNNLSPSPVNPNHNSGDKPLRELNRYERKFYVSSKIVNHVHVAASRIKLTGKIDIEAFRKALDCAQMKLPLLRVCIKEKNGIAAFYPTDGEKIELKIIDKTSEMQWLDLLNRGLKENLDPTKGPLLKVFLIRDSESDVFDFITFCHHSLVDAVAGSAYLKEVVQYYQKIKMGWDVENLQEVFPITEHALRPDILEFLEQKSIKSKREKPLPINKKNKLLDMLHCLVSKNDHKQIYLYVYGSVLGKKISENITSNCEKHKITITSIFGAIYYKHLFRESNDYPFNILLPIDLREVYYPKVQAEELGCYANAYSLPVSAHMGNHLLEISKYMMNKISENALYEALNTYSYLLPQNRFKRFALIQLIKAKILIYKYLINPFITNRIGLAVLNVTNETMQIEEKDSAFVVKEVFNPSNITSDYDKRKHFSLNVTVLNGEFHLTFSTNIPPERAKEIFHSIVYALEHLEL